MAKALVHICQTATISFFGADVTSLCIAQKDVQEKKRFDDWETFLSSPLGNGISINAFVRLGVLLELARQPWGQTSISQ